MLPFGNGNDEEIAYGKGMDGRTLYTRRQVKIDGKKDVDNYRIDNHARVKPILKSRKVIEKKLEQE